ncbi:MAG: hypothetical protein KGQ93_02960 [Cyanobacteria bacterium REEB459]|nr:hypothetical protein [Cyanobacteria bacterium REEB459]
MHDNKVRLSYDVLEKADRIAQEWGLKNARAAVEAVFRRYCDDYLYGRPGEVNSGLGSGRFSSFTAVAAPGFSPGTGSSPCEAIAALDQLLAL